MVVGLAAGRADRLHRGQGGLEPLVAGELTLDQHRGRPLPGRLEPLADRRLEAVPVGHERGQVRVGRIGLRREVQQVEGAAAGAGQVSDDRRDDTAGRARHREYGLAAQLKPVGSVAERDFAQAHCPPAARGPADLDGARIAQRLLDQRVSERRGLPGHREVDRLGQHVGPFAAVGLGESGHRAAERRHGASLVVAVIAAQAGRRDQERALRAQVAFGVEAAHHRVQVLDAALQSGPPARQVEVFDGRLGIERREPVEPVHRPVAEPRGQLRVDVRGAGSGLEDQRGRAEGVQPPDEHVRDAALVGHHDDPLGLVQRDSGGGAPLDRRAQYRSRNPARQPAGRGGIAGERGRGVRLSGLGLRGLGTCSGSAGGLPGRPGPGPLDVARGPGRSR